MSNSSSLQCSEAVILEQADRLFLLERFRDAEDILRKWLMESISASVNVQAVLSQAISRQPGRYKEALKEAKRAIAQDPSDPIGYYVLALILFDGDPKGSLSAIKEALRYGPNRPVFYALQARIYLRMRKPNQALETVQFARRLELENVHCIQIHGVALLHLGKIQQSREVIESGLYIEPNDASLHNVMGWILLRLGNNAQAYWHFSEALRIYPNFKNGREGLLHARKARFLFYQWIFIFYQWQNERSPWLRSVFITVNTLLWISLLTILISLLALIDIHLIWICSPLLIVLGIAFCVPPFLMRFYDLFLRFNKQGKLFLTRDQIWQTNWILGLFASTALSMMELLSSHNGTNALGVFIASLGVIGLLIGWPSRRIS